MLGLSSGSLKIISSFPAVKTDPLDSRSLEERTFGLASVSYTHRGRSTEQLQNTVPTFIF